MLRGLALALLPGLALAQPASSPAVPAWESRVVDWAPTLLACLAGRSGAMVVEAWEEAAGVVARLLLPGGVREDCTGSVRRPAGPARPGEGLRAFMPDRRCVDAWRVVDRAGRELGWLAYPGCG
jgi:hypothetical protein